MTRGHSKRRGDWFPQKNNCHRLFFPDRQHRAHFIEAINNCSDMVSYQAVLFIILQWENSHLNIGTFLLWSWEWWFWFQITDNTVMSISKYPALFTGSPFDMPLFQLITLHALYFQLCILPLTLLMMLKCIMVWHVAPCCVWSMRCSGRALTRLTVHGAFPLFDRDMNFPKEFCQDESFS